MRKSRCKTGIKRLLAAVFAAAMVLSLAACDGAGRINADLRNDGTASISGVLEATNEAMSVLSKLTDTAANVEIRNGAGTLLTELEHSGAEAENSIHDRVQRVKYSKTVTSWQELAEYLNQCGMATALGLKFEAWQTENGGCHLDVKNIPQGEARGELKTLLGLEGLNAVINFRFYESMLQSTGDSVGVNVSGRYVSLNLPELALYNTSSEISFDSVGGPRSDAPLTDVSKDSYFYDAAGWVMENGLFFGTVAPYFEPGLPMTYQEMAFTLAVASGLERADVKTDPQALVRCVFDVEGTDWLPAMADAAHIYYPTNRQEGIAAIVRMTGITVSEERRDAVTIPDLDKIDSEYQNDIKTAYAAGLIRGIDEAGTFCPDGYLYRGDAAYVLYQSTKTA